MGAIQQILLSAGTEPLEFDIVQATRVGACSQVGGSCTATSTAATTTTSGGAVPYSYLWTFVSGDSFTITTPTADSTTFSKLNAVAGDPVFVGVYKCTVTDANTITAEDTVEVTLTFVDLT